jgi:uncharacterized damage-inducible protein DinB
MSPDSPDGDDLLGALHRTFRSNKKLADRAIAQVTDEALRRPLAAEVNSIATIMKHVAGNLRSRWTDVLTSDGEKPWRNRDEEFIDRYANRAELLADWESGWATLFSTLDSLRSADLAATISISGEAQSLALAAMRSLSHISYHVGQIVHIARIHAGDRWETLTIERGGSVEYNHRTWGPATPRL